jgi:TrmH family RNA methyltransferase
MQLSDVVIVLVRPQRAANVAAACRAMKNMGLATLRLVAPAADPGSAEHRAAAYGAWDVLDGAAVVDDLKTAVRDVGLVIGTSGKAQARLWTPRSLALETAKRTGRLAVVFGPEASGLTNDELRLCQATVRIPTAPEQPSLNLAQAVLVVAYEIFVVLALEPVVGPGSRETARGVTAGEIENVLGELRTALLALGYLNRQNPEPILGEARDLLSRAAPTEREVVLLRGLARHLMWAAGRTGTPGGSSG